MFRVFSEFQSLCWAHLPTLFFPHTHEISLISHSLLGTCEMFIEICLNRKTISQQSETYNNAKPMNLDEQRMNEREEDKIEVSRTLFWYMQNFKEILQSHFRHSVDSFAFAPFVWHFTTGDDDRRSVNDSKIRSEPFNFKLKVLFW